MGCLGNGDSLVFGDMQEASYFMSYSPGYQSLVYLAYWSSSQSLYRNDTQNGTLQLPIIIIIFFVITTQYVTTVIFSSLYYRIQLQHLYMYVLNMDTLVFWTGCVRSKEQAPLQN